MKVAAILPAKGTSERIQNKNTELLDGRPLFIYTLEKLVDCPGIDEVYLDTESEQIFDLARELPIHWLRRDPGLATNDTDGHKLFMNAVEQVDADLYIQILCTSPFIDMKTISRGIEILSSGDAYDSIVLVRPEKFYTWSDGRPDYGTGRIPNSVELPETVVETMGLYMTTREAALRTRRRYGTRPYLLEATPLEAIDVNTPGDFALANHIASGMREKERNVLRNLQGLFTSPILSDILDDLNIKGVIKGLRPNLPQIRILGRAKTLKLRSLKEGESGEGIYSALNTYRTIIPQDIIMVENEVNDFAYFGDLNTRMAIRSGAVGAVINGVTRDSAKVLELGFPVFSRGASCSDVRGRATVDCWNRTIAMDEIPVSQGDMVFADPDGIVVIPRQVEESVVERAIEVIRKEASIGIEIAMNQSVESILGRFGEF